MSNYLCELPNQYLIVFKRAFKILCIKSNILSHSELRMKQCFVNFMYRTTIL